MEPTHRQDVLGKYCQITKSQARKSLSGMISGQVLEVLADDPETLHDMPLLLDRLGHRLVDVLKQAGEFRFIIEVNR